MKIQLYWLLSAALLLLPGKADAANNKKPFVIPELQEWRGSQGMFTPTATSRIVYTGKDPSVVRVANQFADDYALMFGRRMMVGKAVRLLAILFSPFRPTAGWERKATR